MKSTLFALLLWSAMLADADTTPPSTPTQLRVAAIASASVSLQWKASSDRKGSGLAGYDIMENGSAVASTTSTAFTVTGLAPSTTFQFAVRARDNAGNVSAFSNTVTATTKAPYCTAFPPTPTGLQATSVSSNSVNLMWNAVTPPAGCAVTYTVYRDGMQAASGLATATYNAGGLLPSTTYQFAVSAADAFGSSGWAGPISSTTAAGGGTSGGFPAHLFAPYIDMLQYPTPSLSGLATTTGQKYFSLAFIVAGKGCESNWGGYYTMAQNFEVNDVATLRAQGGDVIVSFGGAAGTELALACSTVATLQAQYQAVIDRYDLTRIDFDVEGPALGNATSIDRRNKAIAALQGAAAGAGKSLVVQYTLPVLPTGLTSQGLSVLQNAWANGVSIGIVNVMTMDYGSYYDPNQMGAYAVQAMNATISQVSSLYGAAKTDAQVRSMLGVTPEIGLNDVTPEVFTLPDASTVVSAAHSAGIGMLTFWSAGRDQQCPGAPVVTGTCSGITQSPWDFTKIFQLFAGN
ncbi:MAG: fibronectin type III domain-containing protein [Acidobacteriota bacterium]